MFLFKSRQAFEQNYWTNFVVSTLVGFKFFGPIHDPGMSSVASTFESFRCLRLHSLCWSTRVAHQTEHKTQAQVRFILVYDITTRERYCSACFPAFEHKVSCIMSSSICARREKTRGETIVNCKCSKDSRESINRKQRFLNWNWKFKRKLSCWAFLHAKLHALCNLWALIQSSQNSYWNWYSIKIVDLISIKFVDSTAR